MQFWSQILIETRAEQAESLAERLEELGALSVSMQDAADQPLYEPARYSTPLWEYTQVSALFSAGTDMPALQENLCAFLQVEELPCRVEQVQEQDWVRAGQDFTPLRFGRHVWICPSWAEPPEADAVNIFLDPGLAFGTGTHPTTALCLQWLDAHVERLHHAEGIDYGCGSGILAVAALKLGARHVRAVDNDPQALQATRENAAKNEVSYALSTALPEQLETSPADFLLANILAKPLCSLAERFSTLLKPGGALVLSGILAEQEALIRGAYAPWFHITHIAAQEGWLRIDAERLPTGK